MPLDRGSEDLLLINKTGFFKRPSVNVLVDLVKIAISPHIFSFMLGAHTGKQPAGLRV